MKLEKMVRKHLLKGITYESARHEFEGKASVLLNANENAFLKPYNRYPDPSHTALRKVIAKEMPAFHPQNIFVGNGSDEVLDLLFKLFAEPKKDKVLIMPPTFGMYDFLAKLYQVKVVNVPLQKKNFDMDIKKVLKAIDNEVKMIFICHPNNPTGNTMSIDKIETIVKKAKKSIVVIDQAYIEFCQDKNIVHMIKAHPNVVITQTLSKIWGLAAARVGYAIAHEKIIRWLYQIKMPYNLSTISQQKASTYLITKNVQLANHLSILKEQKKWVEQQLKALPLIKKIYASDANFLLVEFRQAEKVFKYLLKHGIVVRSKIKDPYCKNTLRITIGTPTENKKLILCLRNFLS